MGREIQREAGTNRGDSVRSKHGGGGRREEPDWGRSGGGAGEGGEGRGGVGGGSV